MAGSRASRSNEAVRDILSVLPKGGLGLSAMLAMGGSAGQVYPPGENLVEDSK
jgi:hypothetical protein